MRGIIMETKNGRAALLTKDGRFVNIRDKGYSIGDRVHITSNTSRLCAMAASLLVICAGIGSYFMPTGYVSIDINPSIMITVNIYNRVIDIESLNDDARVLLDKIDIKGKSTEDSVEMLIKTSEEIGYINNSNKDVILDIVPRITKPNIESIEYDNIDIIKEVSDMETLKLAQNIGVSVAKAKALEEYSERNGEDIRYNAAKLSDKSVKEIQKIIFGSSDLSDKKTAVTPKPQEQKSENIPEPPKAQKSPDYTISYNIVNKSFAAAEQQNKELEPRYNQTPKSSHDSIKNISEHISDTPQELIPEPKEAPRLNITKINQSLQRDQNPQIGSVSEIKPQQTVEPAQEKPPVESKPIQTEQKPKNNIPIQSSTKPWDNKILQSTPQQTAEPAQEKPPVESKPIQTEQKPQDNIPIQSGTKPPEETPDPAHEDNTPSGTPPLPEQKPPHDSPNPSVENSPNNPTQFDEKNPEGNIPSDKRHPAEQKPPAPEKDNNNFAIPDEPKHELVTEQDRPPEQTGNNAPSQNTLPSSKPKQEGILPPQAEPNMPENPPPPSAPQPDAQQQSKPFRDEGAIQNKPPQQHGHTERNK